MRHMSDWQVPQRVPAIGIDIVGWLLLLPVSRRICAADGLSVKEILQEIGVQTLPGRDESQVRF